MVGEEWPCAAHACACPKDGRGGTSVCTAEMGKSSRDGVMRVVKDERRDGRIWGGFGDDEDIVRRRWRRRLPGGVEVEVEVKFDHINS
mgnify:CR=1 FL=1